MTFKPALQESSEKTIDSSVSCILLYSIESTEDALIRTYANNLPVSFDSFNDVNQLDPSRSYSLILTDALSAQHSFDEIRSMYTNTPVIALTGFSKDYDFAHRDKYSDELVKPFSRSQFFDLLSRYSLK